MLPRARTGDWCGDHRTASDRRTGYRLIRHCCQNSPSN
jgi:hypothetical protein